MERLETLLDTKAGAEELVRKYNLLQRRMEEAANQTTQLTAQFSDVQDSLHKQSHVMPRTLRGMVQIFVQFSLNIQVYVACALDTGQMSLDSISFYAEKFN